MLSSSSTAVPLTAVFKTGLVSVALVKVLFVNVSDPTNVETVFAILKVSVLPLPTESIPVPPASVNVSESIVICPLPLSAVNTKSISVSISLSTYALILCCEAIDVAESLDMVSSSLNADPLNAVFNTALVIVGVVRVLFEDVSAFVSNITPPLASGIV